MPLIYPSPKAKPRTYKSYRIDGERVPSVTAVLAVIRKPFLEQWRGRVGNAEADRIASESAHLGSRIHDACARSATGEAFKPDLDIVEAVVAFRRWLAADVAEVVAVERLVVNRVLQYAGTTDLVCRLHGDDLPCVVDIKTGNYPSNDWPLQLAAYRAALETEGMTIGRQFIVQLGKGEKADSLTIHEYDDHDGAFAAFYHALELWRYLNHTPEGDR